MALTPEDVVNKRFQSTKFREGYDQDEVDDFLDEVVVELRRLNQENEELRQRVSAADAQLSDAQRNAPAPQQSASVPEVVQSAPAPVAPPAPAFSQPAYSSDPSLDTNSTNNLLQLARRLHEEHVREGAEKRDALIAEGHATAARLVADAEGTQRTQIAALENERASIERSIEELRNFERDYRQKLKSYIEGQLRDLDSTSAQSLPEAPQAPAQINQFAAPAPVNPSSTPAPQANSFPGFGDN